MGNMSQKKKNKKLHRQEVRQKARVVWVRELLPRRNGIKKKYMKETRIVITGHGEETRKQLEKLHKSITIWRAKNGKGRPATVLTWAMAAMEALKNKG